MFVLKIRVESKSHFFSPEKSPEKSFVVILTPDHLIGWYLILPNRKVTPKSFFLPKSHLKVDFFDT